MKKITALIMMAITVVIGGVYAAWVYADGVTGSKTEPALSIVVPGADIEGSVGTFSFSSVVEVKIDDVDDANVHKAELVCEGSFTVTFTPNPQADGEEVEKIGVPMKLTPVVVSPATYLGTTIIQTKGPVFSPVFTIEEIEEMEAAGGDIIKQASGANQLGTIQKHTNGTFTWTLNGADILSLLTLYNGEDLYLNSSTEHANFIAALENHRTIKFTVEQYTE